MTTHGPALSTVAGTASPFSRKICVMPTFLPSIALTISRYSALLRMFLAKCLDLDIDARRQIQLGQIFHRLRRRLEDVDQALVSANLKLLARLLVRMRRAQHGVFVFRRGQGNRPRHLRAGTLRRRDNFGRRLVKDPVVVSLQSNSDFLVQHPQSLLYAKSPLKTNVPPHLDSANEMPWHNQQSFSHASSDCQPDAEPVDFTHKRCEPLPLSFQTHEVVQLQKAALAEVNDNASILKRHCQPTRQAGNRVPSGGGPLPLLSPESRHPGSGWALTRRTPCHSPASRT